MRISLLSILLAFSLAGSVQADVSVVINELMASNDSIKTDPQGQYDDWIELYNYGTRSVNIGRMYLTDNLYDPTKWRIPDSTSILAGRYLLIWADGDTGDSGLHANFKLDADGEEIGLFDTDGETLIDSISFSAQTTDISYGRYPDAADDWRLFDNPTPEGQNQDGYLGQVEPPQFNHNRGFYEQPFYLTIATETEGAEIYYTTDFTRPLDLNLRDEFQGTLYTSPILIRDTTCLRVQATKTGWMPSEIVTHTYIYPDDVIRQPAHPEGFPDRWGSRTADYAMDQRVVNDPAYSDEIIDDLKSTPSVCIVIPNSDFFEGSGIYANPTQYGDEWERAASIEWIDPNTGDNFGVNAGLRIHGGPYSRSGNKKNALRVIFRSEYGPSRLEYPLFPDTKVETFKTLALRSIWNYSWSGHSEPTARADYLRDAFARDTIRDMGRLTPHGRGVQVYINGLYWGMYIMTERPDEHFAAEHLGDDKDNYDVLEAPSGYGAGTTMSIRSGGQEALNMWNVLFTIAGNTNLSTPQAYEAIKAYVDIPVMIDYMMMIYYVGSRDAPMLLGNDYAPRNFYAVRKQEPAGPFMFVPWDTEWALENPNINRINYVGVYNPCYLIDKLKANSDFKMLMADHIFKQFYNEGALTREQTTRRYLNLVNQVYGAIVGESARWGDVKRSQPYTRDVEWLAEVDRLTNNYMYGRTETVLTQLRQAGFYPQISPPKFLINSQGSNGGYILPNDLFAMVATQGTIFYTIDGTDPRLPGTSSEPSNQITLVTEIADKRVLVPTGAISNNWRGSGIFNDAGWLSGSGGVGYEVSSGYEHLFSIDVRDRMYGINTSCYIRIPFTLDTSEDNIISLILKIRYDDGFVAYINSVEVARRNFTGTPVWNSITENHDDSEAVNFEYIDLSPYIDALHSGDNILAIHGINQALTSTDFLISTELIAIIDDSSSDSEPEVPTGVQEYTEPIALTESAHVKARALDGGTWSALNEVTFSVGPVAQNLRITELMYHPDNDPNDEYVELTNTGNETINLNLVKFTNGIDFTFGDIDLAPGEYVVVVQDQAAFNARYGIGINIAGRYSGRLNNAGEKVRLEDAVGQAILEFSYRDGWRSITDGDDFSLTIINPSNPDPNSWGQKDSWRPSAYTRGSPGWDDSGIVPDPGSVVINEILAHSHENSPDWIELYNTTSAAIDIGGWYISDSNTNLKKYKIASGTTIASYGYMVFYEDTNFNNPADPGSLTGFALSENGESLYLSSSQNSNLTGYRQVEDFGASATAVSFGRYFKVSTGNYNFVALSETTEGSANAYPKVGPLVISEIMYNPAWPVGGSFTDEQYEYIKLTNISSSPVVLYDGMTSLSWKLTGGIEFTFPQDLPAVIGVGASLYVVKHPEAFSWRYSDISSGQIYGPYEGNLSNAGESIELSMPGEVDGLGGGFYIRIDRVNYSDGSHPEDNPGGADLWPNQADGKGYSLARKELSDYGNDPDNWFAAIPSPIH